jgi:hypothetical protein
MKVKTKIFVRAAPARGTARGEERGKKEEKED